MQRFFKLLFSSLRVVPGVLGLCLLFGLAGSVSAAGTWEYIGSPGFSTFNITSPALAFDSSGTPYVAFRDADPNPPSSVGKLTVKKFDGTNWVTVGSRGFSPTQVSNVKIATDGTVPYVAYTSNTAPYKANVMKFESGSWTDLNSSGLPGNFVGSLSLALDGSTPYLAYVDGTFPSTPIVMKYSSGAWSSLGAGTIASYYGDYTSLAIYDHIPYLAFLDGANSDRATVKKFVSGTWSLVGSAGFSTGLPNFLSLAIDSNGKPYVAYQDQDNGAKATVMKFNGSSWGLVGSGVVSTGIASIVSLDIDSTGKPYVAFQDGDQGAKATVMKFDGTSWNALGAAGFTEDIANEPLLKLYNDTPYLVFWYTGTPYWGVLMKYDLSPTVTAFAASSVTDSFDIPITSFTATGDAPVVGYGITDRPIPPNAGSPHWSSTAPTTYTVPELGTYTLYPWVKDSANRVSRVYGSPVTVEVTASAIEVNSNADTGPGSLRNAIANSAASGVITFDADYTIELENPLLIERDLTIVANTKTIILDGQHQTCVMQINSGRNVNLETLTIRNGSGCSDGGGVLNEGNLTVKNSTFTNNNADYSGAIAVFPGSSLTVTGSTFSGNSANISGGAIYNWYGNVDITNSTFGSNSANSGGAIFNDTDGTLSITDSTLENNTADDSDGGAIYNYAGTTILTRTTVKGNTAQDRGGGIKTESPLNITDSTLKDNNAGRGGAVFNLNAPTFIAGSSVNTNIAYYDGGGIYSEGGTVEVTSSSTVNGNTATTGDGGGIFVTGAAALLKLTGATLDLNTAGRDGGGVHVDTGSEFEITGGALTNNTAAQDGGGLKSKGSGGVTGTTLSGNGAGRNGGGVVFGGAGASFIAESTVSNNTAAQDGGGISNEAGTLDVSNSSVRGNAASGYGGGIKNDTAATLNALADTWEDNQANNDGGAIYNKGTLSISTSSVNNNTSSYRGGGISSSGGTTRLAATAMSGNVARRDGGAIAIQGGSASAITNSTVSGNTAGLDGGEGGGIYTDHTGTLEIANVTLSGNTAPANSGGGISHKNTTDPGSILNLKNTIIANSPTGGDCKTTGTVTGRNNLIKDTGADACNLTDGANGNLIGREPRLAPLASYSGPTKTHKLENDSPAIDAGDQATCDDAAKVNKLDQRSQARDDLQCDIGGFELRSQDTSTVQLTPQTGQMRTFGPIRAGIKSDGTSPGAVTITRSPMTEINIIPARWNIGAQVNSGLDVKLDLCYTASELGSLNESNLKVYRKPSGGNWSEVGTPTISVTGANRCAAVSGVTGFSEWALGTQPPAAPTVAEMGSVSGGITGKGHAVLHWETSNEQRIVGFNVYRRVTHKEGADKRELKQINAELIPAKHPGTLMGDTYRFVDKNAKPGKTYRYRVEVIYNTGERVWTNIVRVKMP